MNRKRWFWIGGVGAGIILALSLVHPDGPVKRAQAGGPLLATADADPPVLDILRRACQDCHSNDTKWPVYSHVAPVSWLVERDVRLGRNQLNLSRWPEYGAAGQQHLLSAIALTVQRKRMPPPRYLFLHREARLSDAERHRILAWTQQELRRLDTLAEPAPAAAQILVE